ncbi:hypothetical protein [Streptomyces sp. NBC_00443]|uniref:hypothetical protein n=1 Tax=Streptomyces sp. NBC_00443 TaxID=2975743 RepID=UPI002E24EDB6
MLFWTGCAAFALSLALVTTLTPHRIWGLCAAVGYAVAAQLARRSPRPWGERGAVAALIGSVVPLTLMIAAGAAQSEVQVVEHSGALLLDSGSPYVPHPAGVDDYNPYLPGMAIFGIPHTLFGGTPLADARVWFCGVFLASMLVAARRADLNRLLRGGISGGTASGRAASSGGNSSGGKASPNAVLLLASFPAVALPLAVGGVDLPVIGLMCLGLALAGRGGSGTAAGLAMGAAAALKWTAWPLLPVGLVLLAATAGGGGRRYGPEPSPYWWPPWPWCRWPRPIRMPSSSTWCSSRSARAGCTHRRPARCRGTCWPRTSPADPSWPWPGSWPPRPGSRCRWRYVRPGPSLRLRTGWHSGWGWRCA